MIRPQTWSSVPLEQVMPLLSRQVISGEKLMLAYVHLKKGCIVPRHSHVNEQASYILQGALRFWLGEHSDSQNEADSVVVSAGQVLVIPGNVPHRAVALEDTLDMDIFAPPREDWLNGTDDYLRAR